MSEPTWLTEMWQRKEDGREVFAHATLKRDVTMQRWHGHNARPDFTAYEVPAGSRVLVTMISRFGDVGIRGRQVEQVSHGYDVRVDPAETLDDVVFVDDGVEPWRKKLMEKQT